ncbi:MAG: hypothetical protein ACKVH8_21190 [Pirellulales bacterium]
METHTVLGLDFGQESMPSMPTSFAKGQTADSLIDDIQHQLHERLQFVKGTDPIVADLLITLGNLIALNDSVDPALDVYMLAMPFPENLSLAQRRFNHFQQIAISNKSSGTLASLSEKTFIMLGILCILAACGLWYLSRRLARRDSNSPLN